MPTPTPTTNLNNIATKLKQSHSDRWYGYLTPAEAVALEDAGAIGIEDNLHPAQNGAMDNARTAATRGLDYLFWYYVVLPRDSEARKAVRKMQRV
jgi:hypothetical protein